MKFKPGHKQKMTLRWHDMHLPDIHPIKGLKKGLARTYSFTLPKGTSKWDNSQTFHYDVLKRSGNCSQGYFRLPVNSVSSFLKKTPAIRAIELLSNGAEMVSFVTQSQKPHHRATGLCQHHLRFTMYPIDLALLHGRRVRHGRNTYFSAVAAKSKHW